MESLLLQKNMKREQYHATNSKKMKRMRAFGTLNACAKYLWVECVALMQFQPAVCAPSCSHCLARSLTHIPQNPWVRGTWYRIVCVDFTFSTHRARMNSDAESAMYSACTRKRKEKWPKKSIREPIRRKRRLLQGKIDILSQGQKKGILSQEQ